MVRGFESDEQANQWPKNPHADASADVSFIGYLE
jgi:hypothetical protein